MTEIERVSAELMAWQLQTIVNEEPYLDYQFPLEQFQGASADAGLAGHGRLGLNKSLKSYAEHQLPPSGIWPSRDDGMEPPGCSNPLKTNVPSVHGDQN